MERNSLNRSGPYIRRSDQECRSTDNRRVREAPAKYGAGSFLGIMMIVCAIMMLLTRFFSLEIDGVPISVDDGPMGVVSKLMLLAGGIIILIKRKKGNYLAVGVYALTLGISRMIRAIPNLGSSNDVAFYSSLLVIALSANLAATGYNHLTVRMKDPLNMRYTTSTILGIYAVVLLYFVYVGEMPTVILTYVPDVMWYIPIYASLLIVLFSKEVADNSPLGRVNSFASEAADRTDLGGDVEVSEEDAEKIKAGLSGPEGWKVKEVGGSAVREETITFETRRGSRDVILERCEGDSDLRITVIYDREDSFINGRRMRVSSVSEFYDHIELRDECGICAILRVRRPLRWMQTNGRYPPNTSPSP